MEPRGVRPSSQIDVASASSRIEWAWLHWCEYLKAQQEFEGWLSKQRAALDVDVELQLGLKEKVWQVDQQRVLVSDVHGQSQLLERLLDEAAALHSRTQDPSVGAQAQEQLQEDYNTVRDRAEVRGHTVPHPPQGQCGMLDLIYGSYIGVKLHIV